MTKSNGSEPADAQDQQASHGPSRREFLRASAAIAGTTLLNGCIFGGEDEMPVLAEAPAFLANIRHLVVVMFENRSFDSLLGYLYSTSSAVPANWSPGWQVPPLPMQNGKQQPFEGLWQFPGAAPQAASACVGTAGCNTPAASYQPVVAFPHNFPNCPANPAPVPPAFVWNFPSTDPEEGLAPTKAQLGKVVTSNGSGAPTAWDMGGFLDNYTNHLAKLPTPPSPVPIMGSYTPDQLPVLSGLAQNFAVFDHWFCAVPSETYCNRAFFHASTSWGFVENGSSSDFAPLDGDVWTKWQSPPGFVSGNSIFDHLEKAKVPWSVYFGPPEKPGADETQIFNVFSAVGLTGLVHYEVGKTYGPPAYQAAQPPVPEKQRFWPLTKFFTDVAAGSLPAYSFVEPVFGIFPGNPVLKGGHDFHPIGDVRDGEEVIRQIYGAIRSTAGTANDYTKDTMLLIVFDENGGTFDHVSPQAPVPAPPVTKPEGGFDFKALGVRVPAIAISSWTLSGTVVNQPMHHAAVINTLMRKFIYTATSKPYLTDRDKDLNGGDLGVAYNNPSGNTPWPWPATFDAPVSAPAVPVINCKN